MPEVAEVALTAEILHNRLYNKKIIDFEFISGRYERKNPEEFETFLDDLPLTVKKIDSKGKFMWFKMINNKNGETWYIFNTFGLTGMWSFSEPKYIRAKITFKNDTLYFSDKLSYGTVCFTQDKSKLVNKINQLYPDFLKDEFSLSKMQKIKKPVVDILMDQTKIGSGIGNYLVAEILYRAKISPHRLGVDLDNDDLQNLTYWIKYIVKLAYTDNHVGYMVNLEDVESEVKRKNYHPDIKLKEKTFKFKVYRKKNDPYGNPVKVDKIVGSGKNKRSTYWVPAVQV